MGDRISFSFVDEAGEGVAFFSHQDGEHLMKDVDDYLQQNPGMCCMNANTVMVDFVRWLTKDIDRVDNNYYLGKDENDGDNSDNGHFKINLIEWGEKWEEECEKAFDVAARRDTKKLMKKYQARPETKEDRTIADDKLDGWVGI